MSCVALRIAYDGTGYHGWQRQKNALTVQEVLEAALSRLYQEEVHVTGCGRTDAGVHARKYLANYRTRGPIAIPPERLPLAVNALLPHDIAVSGACEVPEDFHAVFSCTRKEYTYYIRSGGFRDPFEKDRAWFRPEHLDPEILRRAASGFLGTHDFAAVRSVGTNVKTTVRTVYDFDIRQEGALLSFRIAASGFLYNMARAMVGTVVYAALGKLTPEDIPRILAAGDRTLAGPTVPPQGLYMTDVRYPGAAGRLMEG